jgi:hypothetical protein
MPYLPLGLRIALLGLLAGVATSLAIEPAEDPLDEPLRLLARARDAYSGVRDYCCQLVKRERIDGELTAYHVIDLYVRTQPYSVYLRWREPRNLAGQEVCYVAGENDGKMRVRAAGFLGAVGFVSLALDDPRARKASRHPITQVGIGPLLQACSEGWAAERLWKQTQVRLGTYEFVQRRCRCAELIHPTPGGGKFLFHRNLVYFDEQTHLPIRMENYSWPTQTSSTGELVEEVSFVHLRLNVGLEDKTFRPWLEQRRR